MGQDLPYSDAFDELVETFKEYQGQVYKNGHWTQARSVDSQSVDFGGDIGQKRCYSMFLEELRPLPAIFPPLKQVGFYVSETHWMTDWVVMFIAWTWLKLRPHSVRPVGRFLQWGMSTFHKPPYRVELQVKASGFKQGRPANVQASAAHTDGYEHLYSVLTRKRLALVGLPLLRP